ncbi:MAG: hypothetical protein GXY67_07510 [Clostridiales bacterium]|nr:hypothetical protein [Clostridiales bacterium]
MNPANYFKQIKAFRLIQHTSKELQAPAVALWYALLGTSNDLGHPAVFTVALSALASDAGLSLSGVKRAREALTRQGFIQWQQRPGRACAQYRMLDIAVDYSGGTAAPWESQTEPQTELQTEPQSEPQSGPQTGPQSGPQSGPIIYTKTKTGQTQTTPPLTPPGEGEGEKIAMKYYGKAGDAHGDAKVIAGDSMPKSGASSGPGRNAALEGRCLPGILRAIVFAAPGAPQWGLPP